MENDIDENSNVELNNFYNNNNLNQFNDDSITYLLRTMNEILTSQLTLTRKVDHIKDNFNMINKRIKGMYI